MKNCFGSLNYIFSPHSLRLLKEIGLLNQNSKGVEKSGCQIHNVWLETNELPFCLQFNEIINEVEFLKTVKTSPIEAISPHFLDQENVKSADEVEAHGNFTLKGMIVEDILATQEKTKAWKFPFPIVMAHPDESFFYKKLSYKKKFPYWCLILESSTVINIKDHQGDFSEIEWQNKKAVWLHLETTAWDLLILQA